MKNPAFLFFFGLFFASSLASAKARISMDFSYDLSDQQKSSGQHIGESGVSVIKEIGRGDIDTVITMTPTIENKKEGKENIVVEVNIKNFREGDLISESSSHMVSQNGKTNSFLFEDKKLDEKIKVSLRAKALQ